MFWFTIVFVMLTIASAVKDIFIVNSGANECAIP